MIITPSVISDLTNVISNKDPELDIRKSSDHDDGSYTPLPIRTP